MGIPGLLLPAVKSKLMYDTLKIIHSLLRWLILLAGFYAVLRSLGGITGKKAYTGADGKAGLFYMIFFDLQLLVGLALYFFASPLVGIHDMAGAMKDPIIRFYTVEHETLAIIAFVLVHIGRAKTKKGTDAQRHKTALLFFGIALLLVLALVPWPFRAVGAMQGWF